jgi:hypothetical protein
MAVGTLKVQKKTRLPVRTNELNLYYRDIFLKQIIHAAIRRWFATACAGAGQQEHIVKRNVVQTFFYFKNKLH